MQFFGGAGLQGRLLPQLQHGPCRGLPAVLGHVLGDEPVLHLLNPLAVTRRAAAGATRKLRQQRRGDPGDLPACVAVLAAIHRHPGHAEQPGGVIGQERVVGLRQRDGGLVQAARVQRAPAPVDALHLVRDDDVGVQLRVGGAGVVVVERGSDHPDDPHLRHTAPPHPRCGDALFQQGDGVAHRSVMRLGNQGLRARVRDAPDRADRLRWGERQVKPRNGRARRLRKLFLTDTLHRLLPLRAPQLGVEACNPGCNPLARGLQLREPGTKAFAGDRM